MTRTPARDATSIAPVRSSTRRVSPMPERSASVMVSARRACRAPNTAASVCGCVDAGNASSLLKLALTATPRPLQPLNSSASRQAATAFARSASRATTTRPRSGAGHAESGVANTAAVAAAPCSSCRRESESTLRLYRALEAPPGSAWARDEAAQIASLAPGRDIDREAGGLDRPLGVAIPVTAAGKAGPERLPAILKARLEAARRAHVLEHAQRAAGPQHASDLGEPTRGIGHAAEHEPADHGVEGAVAKRQSLGVTLHQRHAGRAAPRGEQRLARRIEADHSRPRVDQGQVAAGAAADVERAARRPANEPAAPSAA